MAIKNILVHIDHSMACETRVNAATDLARQNDARLSALFIVPDYFMPSYVEAQISTDIITQINDEAMERAKKTMSKVRDQVNSAGLSIDAYIEEGNLIATLGDYARYTDLLVLGQNQPEDPDNISEALAEHLVIDGGAPCLVIPFIGARKTLAKRILVAWNESRESYRALKDALPLLKHADMVEVLFIKPRSHNQEHTSLQENVIINYLVDHGITAKVNLCIDNHIDPGNTILSQTVENDIDLVVMGAFGHSRLREIVLGGATRHLLKKMTAPVFISH